jgi:heavy metal sensor kinase
MAIKLSIGVRWALRYTVAMSVTLTIFAIVIYTRVERRINREAHLVAEIQSGDLLESLRTQTAEHTPDQVRAWLDGRTRRMVEESDPHLGLGVEYLDREGRRVLVAGSLTDARVPVPEDLLRGERDASLRAVNLDGEYAHLLSVVAAPGGFLQVAIHTKRYAENLAHVRDVLLLAFPVMLLLTGGLGWLLARGSLSSIAAITGTAKRISGSNLRESIPTTGSGDELDELAQTLNAMMQRIREGLERMHRFNANAAHEIRTPLSTICGQIEVALQEARDPEEYRQILERVLKQAHHLAGGVNAMLRLSRSEAGLDPEHVEWVGVAPLLESVLEFFEPVASERGITLEAGEVPDASVRGDESWLVQLFSNLLDNAVKYCASGDRIRVGAEVRGHWLLVHVADTGPGLSSADLAGLFERFQRGSHHRSRPGFGLGLPIAQEIARAHGGRVEAESHPGKGATFTVWLPLAEPAAAGRGARGPRSSREPDPRLRP